MRVRDFAAGAVAAVGLAMSVLSTSPPVDAVPAGTSGTGKSALTCVSDPATQTTGLGQWDVRAAEQSRQQATDYDCG